MRIRYPTYRIWISRIDSQCIRIRIKAPSVSRRDKIATQLRIVWLSSRISMVVSSRIAPKWTSTRTTRRQDSYLQEKRRRLQSQCWISIPMHYSKTRNSPELIQASSLTVINCSIVVSTSRRSPHPRWSQTETMWVMTLRLRGKIKPYLVRVKSIPNL